MNTRSSRNVSSYNQLFFSLGMIERLQKFSRYRKMKDFFETYERVLIPGMLVAGVIVDFITFRSIHIRTAFIILIVYFIIAGMAIAFLNTFDSIDRPDTHEILRYVRLGTPFLIQFTFGALLSASLIFYWFSGTFSVSWPFILFIAFLMTSNEVLRHYYLKPVVQMGVYFFILFSLLTLILPYVFNSISAWLFLVSGAISLILILIYTDVLSRFLKEIKEKRTQIFVTTLTIYALMNAFYVFNVIPPIPLSLREASAYHGISRSQKTYTILAEKESFLDKILPGQTVHIQPGDRVYVYTSIFAPFDLTATIVHHWQKYDEENGGWITTAKPSFTITGGREDGYRGYSYSSNVSPGKWRVSVETERGQALGSVRFSVQYVDASPELETVVK